MNNTGKYEYNLTDHPSLDGQVLSNVQVNSIYSSLFTIHYSLFTFYYPFGLQMSGQHFQNTDFLNKYLYNGKELQNQTGWFDFGFRQLDPQLGRWHVVDAMAEKYFSTSPYAYALNNPINNIDVMGLQAEALNFQRLWNMCPANGVSEWVRGGGGGGEYKSYDSYDNYQNGISNQDWESYTTYSIEHPRRMGDISWRNDKVRFFFHWLFNYWDIKEGVGSRKVSDNDPYELPEKNEKDMFGVYGLDWGIETDDNVLQNSAPSGINREEAIRYYYCRSCIYDPGNGIAERGRYLYQKPVYVRSQVYGHQVPRGINIDTGANSFAITSVGYSMGHFAHNNSFSLSDFDLSLSNTLFEAQIDITINPNIPGVENIKNVKDFIEQRWKGTNVNIIYDRTLELYYYNVQISVGKW